MPASANCQDHNCKCWQNEWKRKSTNNLALAACLHAAGYTSAAASESATADSDTKQIVDFGQLVVFPSSSARIGDRFVLRPGRYLRTKDLPEVIRRGVPLAGDPDLDMLRLICSCYAEPGLKPGELGKTQYDIPGVVSLMNGARTHRAATNAANILCAVLARAGLNPTYVDELVKYTPPLSRSGDERASLNAAEALVLHVMLWPDDLVLLGETRNAFFAITYAMRNTRVLSAVFNRLDDFKDDPAHMRAILRVVYATCSLRTDFPEFELPEGTVMATSTYREKDGTVQVWWKDADVLSNNAWYDRRFLEVRLTTGGLMESLAEAWVQNYTHPMVSFMFAVTGCGGRGLRTDTEAHEELAVKCHLQVKRLGFECWLTRFLFLPRNRQLSALQRRVCELTFQPETDLRLACYRRVKAGCIQLLHRRLPPVVEQGDETETEPEPEAEVDLTFLSACVMAEMGGCVSRMFRHEMAKFAARLASKYTKRTKQMDPQLIRVMLAVAF